MIAALVFTCGKDAELTPLCVKFLRQRSDVKIILCDDQDHPSGVEGFPTIKWSLRGEGGWAGGVSKCLQEALCLMYDCEVFATVDSDVMVLDPSFFDLPEGIDARGCPRPKGLGWFSLRAIRRGLIPFIQGVSGQEEDKIIGRALQRESEGAYLEDGVLLASQDERLPLGALRGLGAHAVHVGQFLGDHQAREKAFRQASNLFEMMQLDTIRLSDTLTAR